MEEATARIASKLQVQYEECPTVLAVLGIRIQIRRIRVFLGLPDPYPSVRGTDPDPAPDPSLSHKGLERTKTMLAKLNFLHKIFAKNIFFRRQFMCQRVS
jgi:hypothetical protein